MNDRRYLLLNYSSRLEKGRDYPWLRGQLGTTRLYSQILTFDRPAETR